MTKERRQYFRTKLRVPTAVESELRKRSLRGQTLESSEDGSLIRGPIPLEAGSGLELRIDLGEFCLAPVEDKSSRSIPESPARFTEFADSSEALMGLMEDFSDDPDCLS